MFEAIDNQAYADLAGCRYDAEMHCSPSGLVYGRTHIVKKRLHALTEPCVLLTSFSDEGVTDKAANRLPHTVKAWFSNNVVCDHPRVHPIPIGFAFNVERTKLLMEHVAKGPHNRAALMYVNFTRAIPRIVNPRVGLYERFGSLPWVMCKGGDGLTSVPPAEFYLDIRHCDYVLSPPGAGPDCHRHWESMALGSIPIVLRSQAVSLLDDMPALQVDSWDEVTPEKLNAELTGLRGRFAWPSMRKIDMAYWRKGIMDAVGRLRDP